MLFNQSALGTKEPDRRPQGTTLLLPRATSSSTLFQHVLTILKPGGAQHRIADNCLFEDKAAEVFEIVMTDCNVHTILRLPRGTFVPYSKRSSECGLFEERQPTDKVWIYDCRFNIPSCTKKDRPLTAEMFADFEKAMVKTPTDRQTNRPGSGRALQGVRH
jgi:type I restriction enzyme M protein